MKASELFGLSKSGSVWSGDIGWIVAVAIVLGGLAWIRPEATVVPSLTSSALASTDDVLQFPKPAGEISAANRRTLDPWTGSWKGTFSVYTQDGKLATRLAVRQRYWWDGPIQRATFHETDRQGAVVTAEAANYQSADGRLVCTVEKSNGERSLHEGVSTDGFLFWHAKRAGVTETFKERVIDDGADRRYTIEGFGLYNGAAFLFAGDYGAVDPSLDAE